MMKKTLPLLVLALSLFANEPNEKYLDDTKLDSSEINFFIGVDGSYNYQIASESLDKSALGYSLYAGVPIYDFELIGKISNATSNNLDLKSKSITFNIPISGTGSRSVYIGFIGGSATATFNDSTKTNFNIIDKSNDGNFYGVHIGKRYKYSENFFSRMEFEYLKYNLQAKTNTTPTSVNLDNSFSFIYGLEYRF
ncbi:MAG: hypothetical protein PHF17_01335 [Arcobacteraceae bacterium]|jgi:opacity protein-like surface antigen|nr:hypothetical protein [Arcobacteraceae bacterium]